MRRSYYARLESEKDYPLPRPINNGNQHPIDDDDELIEPMQVAQPARSGEQKSPTSPLPPARPLPRSVHTSRLPRNGLRNSIIAGVIAGVLCTAQSIIITIANASTYNAFDAAKQATVKSALAFTIFGFAMLTFIISMLIILIAGFIVGKAVVRRWFAFLAGFIAGLLTYALSFLVQYIPNYPGTHGANGTTAGTAALAGGIFISLIFLLVWGIIGGLISLLGAWLATRRHPITRMTMTNNRSNCKWIKP